MQTLLTRALQKLSHLPPRRNSKHEVMTIAAIDVLQQMDKLNSRLVALDSYFSATPSVQGMVQLNLMAPRYNYYGNQQTIQGLGQMDFFRTLFSYIRDDPNVKVAQLHDDASRHT
ncbi:hypothetical protein REPUB_Repub17cG0109700 [Reevesia pubescens]